MGNQQMALPLSLACWDYDRVKALEDGRGKPEGIRLNFLNYRVEETFVRPEFCIVSASQF